MQPDCARAVAQGYQQYLGSMGCEPRPNVHNGMEHACWLSQQAYRLLGSDGGRAEGMLLLGRAQGILIAEGLLDPGTIKHQMQTGTVDF